MMRVLIVEDERPAAERLGKLIREINPDITIEGITETVEETVNWLTTHDLPTLILMDIQLDDGLCFEIFDTLSLDVPIIFTTAFNEYTLQAFKVNSIDYLLKPIDKNELQLALDKYSRITQNHSDLEAQIKKAFQELKTTYRSRFLIKVGANYKSIGVSEISCFYIQHKGTYLQTLTGHSYAVDFSLEQLLEMLDPHLFYRINRSCVVQIDAICQLNAFSSSRLQLTLENMERSELLVISRDKVSDFKKWMSQ